MSSLIIAVASQNNSGTPGAACAISTDGATFSLGSGMPVFGSGASHGWSDIAYSPALGLFCAVSPDNPAVAATTSTGTSWTTGSISNHTWNSICWSPGLNLFCAVSKDGHVATSPDGITWTDQTAANSNPWWTVCWSPSLTLFAASSATGSGATIMTSPDGVTWTGRTPPAVGGFVTWDPTSALFCDSGDLHSNTSPDGITWTAGGSQSNFTFATCALHGGGFLVVGNSGFDEHSSNGTTWAAGSTTTGGANGNSACYDTIGGNYFVGGGDGNIYGSSDASTWAVLTGSGGGSVLGGIDAASAPPYPSGTFNVTETPDSAVFDGYVNDPGITGQFVSTEAADTFSAAGYPAVIGMFVSTEAADSFSAFGGQPRQGVMASTETPDSFAATGVGYGETLVLESSESLDIFAAEGYAIQPVIGTFNATETPDSFRALGAGATATIKRPIFFVT